MEPLSTIIATTVACIVATYALSTALWARHERRRIAMVDSGLVCDNDQVQTRAEDGTYLCPECLYDSRWTVEPRMARRTVVLRALGWALTELREAHDFISMTPSRAPQMASLIGHRSHAEDNYLEASTRSMTALTLIEPWMNEYPRLAELPFMGDDDGTGMVQKFLEPSHARARESLDESIQTIEAVRLHIGVGMVREARREGYDAT